MGFNRIFAAGLAVAALAGAVPAMASGTSGIAQAESVKRLDIMLMVSSLRCRHSSDDFQPEYRRFSARHLATLNQAHRTMSADYTRRHGAKAGKRALDKVSTGMANRYGQGHPWMDCAELKQVTAGLADHSAPEELHLAAQDLLATRPREDRLALVARYR